MVGGAHLPCGIELDSNSSAASKRVQTSSRLGSLHVNTDFTRATSTFLTSFGRFVSIQLSENREAFASCGTVAAEPHRGSIIFSGRDPVIRSGGADRDRTDDLRLAKPALSQLSYSPVQGVAGTADPTARPPSGVAQDRRVYVDSRLERVGQGRVELPTSRLSGVRSNHLSYWPFSVKGPGSSLWSTNEPFRSLKTEPHAPALRPTRA
jgi:hypothetical protein